MRWWRWRCNKTSNFFYYFFSLHDFCLCLRFRSMRNRNEMNCGSAELNGFRKQKLNWIFTLSLHISLPLFRCYRFMHISYAIRMSSYNGHRIQWHLDNINIFLVVDSNQFDSIKRELFKFFFFFFFSRCTTMANANLFIYESLSIGQSPIHWVRNDSGFWFEA